ncbi:hypothetical protein [Actinokineospora globicatena]|uniref:hypothetical protein n=1 Tax=Actinokineospora globicatena TaxID=103729 RepID=UPI0025532510|nr:hypothetical protein [Actinokineospora globicatena]
MTDHTAGPVSGSVAGPAASSQPVVPRPGLGMPIQRQVVEPDRPVAAVQRRLGLGAPIDPAGIPSRHAPVHAEPARPLVEHHEPTAQTATEPSAPSVHNGPQTELQVVSLSRAVDPTPPATDAPTLGALRLLPVVPNATAPREHPVVQRAPESLPTATPPTPRRPVTLVPAVQRVDDPPPPPEPEPAPTPEAAPPPVTQVPAAPAAVSTAAPASGAPPETVPEELVRKLFDPLLRRLKTELRLDRERRGRVTDRWR